MNRELNKIPGVVWGFSQPIEDNMEEAVSGVKGELAIKVYGDDLKALEDKSAQIAGIMGTVKGVVSTGSFPRSGPTQFECDGGPRGRGALPDQCGGCAGRGADCGGRTRFDDLIRTVTGRGVAVRRLRVVSEPVSDYIRFEHATTDSNIAAGEQVRWLPRRLAAELLLPGCDCWIFDGRKVLFNLFGGAGEWAGISLCDDPRVAARHAAAFGTAWDRGVPHADYRLA